LQVYEHARNHRLIVYLQGFCERLHWKRSKIGEHAINDIAPQCTQVSSSASPLNAGPDVVRTGYRHGDTTQLPQIHCIEQRKSAALRSDRIEANQA